MEQDGQPSRPPKRASQSDLRVESLGGPPQVSMVVAAHLHVVTYIPSQRQHCTHECKQFCKTGIKARRQCHMHGFWSFPIVGLLVVFSN